MRKQFILRLATVAAACFALGLVGGLLKGGGGKRDSNPVGGASGDPPQGRITAISAGGGPSGSILLSKGQRVPMSIEQFDAFIEQNKRLQVLVGAKLDSNLLAHLGIDREAVGKLQESVDRTIRDFQSEDVARREVILNDAGEIERIVVPAYPDRAKNFVSELHDSIEQILGAEQASTLMPLFHRGLERLTSKEGTTRREFKFVPTGDGRFELHVTVDGVGPEIYTSVVATSVPEQWRHIVDIVNE